MDMKTRLIELLEIHGVSGNEKLVRDYLFPVMGDLLDRVTVDETGNLLGFKRVGTGKGATILLSAHMDTVKGVSEEKRAYVRDGIVKGFLPDGSKAILGADDRAGIAIVIEVLNHVEKFGFNGVIKVAFTVQEEVGSVGADSISESFLKDVDLAIVVDRRNNRDIVVGSSMPFCSDSVGDFIERASQVLIMDWKCTKGGSSDAQAFALRGINSINLSAGYQNEHTVNEFVSIPNMYETTMLIQQVLAMIQDKKFEPVSKGNRWIDGSVFKSTLDVWEEQSDINGDIYAYSTDEGIVLKQGDDEICMEAESFKELYEKVSFALAKRS